MSKSLIYGLMAVGICRFLSSSVRTKITKFRNCETPLVEPGRAKVSPYPEGRDLGRG